MRYNPGQNVFGHLRKLGTKTNFAKLTDILPLKKAWGCCYKGLFLLSPYPPSSVDCVSVQRVLTRVVDAKIRVIRLILEIDKLSTKGRYLTLTYT